MKISLAHSATQIRPRARLRSVEGIREEEADRRAAARRMYSECFPRNRLFVRPSPSFSSSSSSSTWTVVWGLGRARLEWARRTHASCACLRFRRVIDERWRETRVGPPLRRPVTSTDPIFISIHRPPPSLRRPGLFHVVVVMVARSPRSYFVSPPLEPGIDLEILSARD